MHYYIFIITTLLLCSIQSKAGEDVKNLYAPSYKYDLIKSELNFWQNRSAELHPVYDLKEARTYLDLFMIDGDMEHLIAAENLLDAVINAYEQTSAKVFRMRAGIQMKQHRFCDALEDLLVAEIKSDDLVLTEAMLFDVYFELSDDEQALFYLDKLSKRGGFEFLIRKARLEDSIGNLDGAIESLESCFALIAPNDLNKRAWLYSNLGDFYGHKENIAKSEEYYRSALLINSADWHSMKGLAWIAYSSEEDYEKALSILNRVSDDFNITAINLLQAEIMDMKGLMDEASELRNGFMASLKSERYFSSYASYVFKNVESVRDLKLLESISQYELSQNPSPSAFLRRAQLLHALGKTDKARLLIDDQVLGKTGEPLALYQSLKIIDESHPDYSEINSEVHDAAYELGPQLMHSLN